MDIQIRFLLLPRQGHSVFRYMIHPKIGAP